jgi:hypothetical protein
VTTSQLPRRTIVGAVLATALIGGGIVAAFAADAPATGACPSWTDPKGDASTQQQGAPQTGDTNLDITAATFSVVGDAIVASITTDNLSGDAESSNMITGGSDAGDEFRFEFTVGGKAVQMYFDRLPTSDFGTNSGFAPNPGGNPNDPSGTAEGKVDIKAKTVTITGKLSELAKVVGKPTAGLEVTALSAWTSDTLLGQPVFDYDDAATKSKVTLVDGCGGGAAAPAPSASASATPEPSPSASAPPAGGAPAGGAPLPDCFTAKDPTGDAWYPASAVPSDDDLDLTGVTLGTTNDALVAYFKVKKLAAGPMTLDGHRFTLNFTFNKRAFAAAGSAYKNAQSAQMRDGFATSGRVGHVTQLSIDPPGIPPTSQEAAQRFAEGSAFVASGLKYVFDLKTSTVSLSLPLADITKNGGASAVGATFTGVYATAATDTTVISSSWDVAPDGATSSSPGKLTYTVGDNACFGAAAPAASPLSNVGAVKAQYGDVAAVAAKLVDAAGAAVAGKTVTFALGASKATGVTGADGVAKASLTVKDKAGKRSLAISSDDVKTAVAFTVLVEKTALKAVGSKGAVTATLTDDDKKPVAGQAVTFTSGSKKVTAKTDAKGVAKATGLPAGNVKVTYAGAAGMYTATSTSTKA